MLHREQIFSFVKVISGLFVINSKKIGCSNAFV
jgi:hypothetical protein